MLMNIGELMRFVLYYLWLFQKRRCIIKTIKRSVRCVNNITLTIKSSDPSLPVRFTAGSHLTYTGWLLFQRT